MFVIGIMHSISEYYLKFKINSYSNMIRLQIQILGCCCNTGPSFWFYFWNFDYICKTNTKLKKTVAIDAGHPSFQSYMGNNSTVTKEFRTHRVT